MREISVQLVVGEACHFCDHARKVLTRLARRYPITVSEISIRSEAGQRLVERDGILFPPGIYMDGHFHGYGRLSERALLHALEQYQ